MKAKLSIFSIFLFSISIMTIVASAADVKMEQNILTDVGSTWQTVNLLNTYADPVVVATPQYTSNDLPAVTRIRNASGNSFDIRVQNPSGQPLSGYIVQYMVVESGVYTSAEHGITMEAVKVTSTITDKYNSWSGEAQIYNNSYTSPVIFGQVMTQNDAAWSVFWSRGINRGEPAANGNLYVGKHVGQDNNTTRTDETIGYVVMESGSGVINGQPYEVGLGSDRILGIGDTPPYSYGLAPNSWEHAILSQSAMDGNDGSWAVLYGTDPISENGLELSVDEDQLADSERRHTSEQVGYFVSNITLPKPPSIVTEFDSNVIIGDIDGSGNDVTLEVYGTSNLGPVTLDVVGGDLGPADNVDYEMAPFWLQHDGLNFALDGDQLSTDAVPFIIQNTNPNGGIVFKTGANDTERLIIDPDGTVKVLSPAGDIPMCQPSGL